MLALRKATQDAGALSKDVRVLKDLIASKDAEYQTLDEKAKTQVQDLENKITQAQTKATASDERVNQLTKELSQAKAQLSTMVEKSKVDAIADKMQENQKQMTLLTKQVQGAQESLNNAIIESNTLKDQVKSLTREKELAVRQLNDKQVEMSLANRKLEDAKSDLKALKDSADAQAQKDAKDIASFNEQSKRLNEQLTTLRDEIQGYKSQLASIDAKAMQSTIDELKAKLSESQERFNQAQKDLKTNRDLAQDRQAQVNVLNEQLTKANDQVNRLNIQVKSFEHLNEISLGNEGYMLREGKDLSTMIYKINQQIKEYQNQLIALTASNENIKIDYEKSQVLLEANKELLKQCQDKLQELQPTPASN